MLVAQLVRVGDATNLSLGKWPDLGETLGAHPRQASEASASAW
ncbi:hypothetical protein Xcel_2328 [Xylanimonas cellulosilytica DSM 15894]|uniref:Uncharacterized protein n=1 Tax=Xylanimonas cellulosilytica (strain DSM 15894 / JCM 12276 / CECT 5975 / KCTC 9989 / LMG 20990 / NBRC 107835 / XIL07) TaxID=446471 RepID=D1BVM6_XYLCX|nr:hypothetical protein Xcel_2328 [Xylanimonas cellulosilytica DSM 15894]